MELNGMVLLDNCILMSFMTRFTGDIPKTFNMHSYYTGPSESSGKLDMHIPARS